MTKKLKTKKDAENSVPLDIPVDGEKSRLLVFADGNFLAHVSRALEVSKILRNWGYDIHFASRGQFRHLIEKAGFIVHNVVTIGRNTTLHHAKKAGLVDKEWWTDITYRSIDSDIRAIRKVKPYAVLGDMHWSLKASAAYLKRPYISIVNAHWTKYSSAKMLAPTEHILTRILGKKITETILPTVRKMGMQYWASPYKHWQQQNVRSGIKVESLMDVMEGDLTLMPDIPEFFPVQDKPDSVYFVGPILWKPDLEVPSWLENLKPGKPTIYVTMGSTGVKKILDVSYQAFKEKDYNILATTGNLQHQDFERHANFYVTNYAPGLALLAKSDVTVNHAGNGSIYQALAAGVPMVCIPTHIDQEMNAQRIEHLNCGRFIHECEITPELLEQEVNHVLEDPVYNNTVKKVSARFKHLNGQRLAAQYSHEYLQRGKVVSDPIQ
ncbi:glycosyltransferase [candidate division CSSED10-310 bacterium]|uniref:Glycosyltransferase n=1 Tax=candidate division CSSED10-310 bacterium TaxID=2855610 RepID=A0ABV6Z503_UNCC1